MKDKDIDSKIMLFIRKCKVNKPTLQDFIKDHTVQTYTETIINNE